jgi:hypothetical protein
VINRPKLSDAECLPDELAQLGSLDRSTLRQRWKVCFGSEPPPRTGRWVMIAAVAYALQEGAFGGLRPSTRRLLARIAEDAAAHRPLNSRRRKTGAGTVLLREWHGVTHRVTVLEHGILFRGKHYRSLSQVAREITGCGWSGPLFFGLRSARKEARNGKS